jgi:hypothetical protein
MICTVFAGKSLSSVGACAWERGSERERCREPRRDDAGDRLLAPVVEVIAVGNDLDLARPAGVLLEFLGGVAVAVLLVPADGQRRAFDLRRERHGIGHRHDAVKEALGRDDPPPARHEHELPPSSSRHQVARPRRELLLAVAREKLLGAAGDRSYTAAPRRKQDQRRSLRVVHDVAHAQHAAVAVPDDDRMRKAARRYPGGCDPVVGQGFCGGLERAAHGVAAVAGAQYVVTTAVEREAGEPQARQHRRQETRRADVEVHGVAVEQQDGAACLAALGLVPGPVERIGIGGNGNQLGVHRGVLDCNRGHNP